jgi:CBS-domain-containing membrane protein
MALACLFTFVTILGLSLAADATKLKLLIPPFGASAVMIFIFPQGPFSKIQSLVGGHLLTSGVGLGFYYFFPDSTIALALAVTMGLLGMLLTKTLHPAAGGNPILVYLLKAGPSFLIAPILIGTLFLALMGWLYGLLQREST